MRRKLVLWGSNEKDEKMLVALELLEKENIVDIYTFPESIATEQFYKDMTEQWRDDKEVEFPTGYKKIVQKLSVSESLLPDDIRVERPELISRAQAEWHFVVLSSKLYELYRSEIEEIKEKVDGITEYDNMLWDEMKEFWSKVQAQVNEKNLFREHGAALREKSNAIFDKLKQLRKEFDKKFEQQSKGVVSKIAEQLGEIEDKIEKGLGLHPLFDELKKIQTSLHNFKFTRGDRDDLWSKIDAVFKKLKEKRGASQPMQHSNANNNLGRVESRLSGLEGAIQKMQKSIDFDQNELDFQSKKVADSDGQLESQLRVAKIRMIEERINSKKEKLDDMYKTKAELDVRVIREQKRAEKVEKQEKIEEAKETVKLKIASEISENAKELEGMSDKLEKAASELAAKPRVKSMIQKLTDAVEDIVEDIVVSVKAVAEVVEEKYEDLKDKAEDKIEDLMDKAEDLKDTVEDKIEDLKDKAEDKIEDLKDKAIELKDNIADKLDDLKDKAEDKYEDDKDEIVVVEDTVEDKIEDQKDKAEDKYDDAKDKAIELKDNIADKLDDLKDKAEDKYEDDKDEIVVVEENVEDKIEDLIDKAEDNYDEIKS